MNDKRQRRDTMHDRQKAECWAGIRIPINQSRLADAAAALESVLGDVEAMYLSADDMGGPIPHPRRCLPRHRLEQQPGRA